MCSDCSFIVFQLHSCNSLVHSVLLYFFMHYTIFLNDSVDNMKMFHFLCCSLSWNFSSAWTFSWVKKCVFCSECIKAHLSFLCLVSLVVTLSGSAAKDLLYQAANLTRQLLLCFHSECLSFSRFHTFPSVQLGFPPDQIFLPLTFNSWSKWSFAPGLTSIAWNLASLWLIVTDIVDF